MASRLHLITYDKDHLEEDEELDLATALDHLTQPTPRTRWLTLYGAEEADFQLLEQRLDIHPLALEDARNQRQRAKVEEYDKHLYVVVRGIENLPEGRAIDHQSNLFFGDGWVLVVHERPLGLFDGVRDRLRKGRVRIRSSGADYLLYALIDAAVDTLFPALEDIGDQVEEMEETIRSAELDLELDQVHLLKRELRRLRRVVWPTRDMLAAIMRDEPRGFRKNTLTYMRDIHDHAIQAMDLVETHKEAVTSVLDLHLTLISNKMNEVMKVLTIVATMFIPITFLAGVYGMNFERMPELGWTYAYPVLFWSVVALVFGFELWYFRRKGWF